MDDKQFPWIVAFLSNPDGFGWDVEIETICKTMQDAIDIAINRNIHSEVWVYEEDVFQTHAFPNNLRGKGMRGEPDTNYRRVYLVHQHPFVTARKEEGTE